MASLAPAAGAVLEKCVKPMDPVSHRIANALVGNPGEAATLECTVVGPELLFGRDALVSLYGAAFEAKAGGLPFPRNRPVLLASPSPRKWAENRATTRHGGGASTKRRDASRNR